MKNLKLSGLVIFLACASAPASFAQNEDIVSVVRSGICPKDLTPYDTVKYSDHCAGMDERSCSLNDKACFEDAKQCWDQVNLLNKQIFSYNNFMRNCAAALPPDKPAKNLPTKLPKAKKN